MADTVLSGRGRAGRGEPWGQFLLTWVRPGAKTKCGAWQATCYYHRMETVACTKRVNCDGNTEADSTLAKNRCKHWCTHAILHTRKVHHGGMQPRSYPTPTEDWLEDEVLTMPRPPMPLLTDEQLDYNEKLPEEEAAEASAGGGAADDADAAAEAEEVEVEVEDASAAEDADAAAEADDAPAAEDASDGGASAAAVTPVASSSSSSSSSGSSSSD